MAHNKAWSCKNAVLSGGYGATNTPEASRDVMHVHEMCEIYCVWRGSGYYITEGARHKLEPGKLLLMRPGEAHKSSCNKGSLYERVSIHFLPSVVDSIDPERRLLRPFFDRPLGERNVYTRNVLSQTSVYENLKRLNVEGFGNDELCLRVLTSLFAILSDLCDVFDSEKTAKQDENSFIMREVVEYINNNLSGYLSLDSICEKFFLSRSNLNKSFKYATGSTVWEYITLKRLNAARRYISEGATAAVAATESGFRDYSTFYRAHIKEFGTPPTSR